MFHRVVLHRSEPPAFDIQTALMIIKTKSPNRDAVKNYIADFFLLRGEAPPGPRIPPGACQPIFMFERSLQNCVFRNKFRIHWFDGLPFKMSTTYILGSFTNIGYL